MCANETEPSTELVMKTGNQSRTALLIATLVWCASTMCILAPRSSASDVPDQYNIESGSYDSTSEYRQILGEWTITGALGMPPMIEVSAFVEAYRQAPDQPPYWMYTISKARTWGLWVKPLVGSYDPQQRIPVRIFWRAACSPNGSATIAGGSFSASVDGDDGAYQEGDGMVLLQPNEVFAIRLEASATSVL
jgi:hypothetical protein